MQRSEVERLYDEHAEGIYRFLLALVRHREDARDLVQDVFVRVARSEGVMDGVADHRAFLFRIARNAAFDRARRIAVRRRARASAETSPFARSPDPDVRAFRDGVAAALAELPDAQRSVVYLKLWENMTFERIADICAISTNTAASRYRYGVEKLQALLHTLYMEITE